MEEFTLEASRDFTIDEEVTANTMNESGPDSPLVACIKAGNMSESLKHLEDGADINETDDSGNSLLMIAAFSGNEGIMSTLIKRGADLCLKNTDDEDVFKIAVASSDLDVLKTLVESVAGVASVTQYTEGPLGAAIGTALFEAASLGHTEKIEALLHLIQGANINVILVNANDDTVLHCFTKSTAKCDSATERQETVLKQLVSFSLRQWFKSKSLSDPEFNKPIAYAIHDLFREQLNKDGKSVLSLAFRLGSVPVIEAYFSQDNVTFFTSDHFRQYDVTNTMPQTMTSSAHKSVESYLDLLLKDNPKHIIASVLDMEPIKQIEVMYSSLITIIYLIIILLHTLYMSVFSYSSVVLMNRARSHHWHGAHSIDVTSIIFYTVVPLEPLYFLVDLGFRFRRYKTMCINTNLLSPGDIILQCFSIINRIVYIFLVAALLYEYTTVDMNNTLNTLSVTLLVGWLTTISFTQGLKPFCFFWRMIMQMISVDVYKVLFVYVFVLFGFSLALHAQMQISSTLIQRYPTPFHTMFFVFRLMVGMGTLFDGEFENDIEEAGGSLALPALIYTLYIVLSTIVLLNLLIAMMNDSYSNILTNMETPRRIKTFQRAIRLEETVPWMARWISKRVIKCGRVENGQLAPSDAPSEGLLWYVEVARKDDATSPVDPPKTLKDKLLLLYRLFNESC